MRSPYQNLPRRAFWRTGVRNQDWLGGDTDLWQPKFEITPEMRVMTAGSCFAQHIARHLRARGQNVIDTEPPPRRMKPETARAFGYLLYSARYGNIYTARQLLQVMQEATGVFPRPPIAWERDGRWFDAIRPSVEPEGLDSPEEVAVHRRHHLKSVRRALRQADVFVFTLGLTEAWEDLETGRIFPTAPGTIAGSYDPARCSFRNFTHAEVLADFLAFRKIALRNRPGLKFLLTVSPVPLTATASGSHVLPATIYSKSVLRAVAGQLTQEFDDIDYFPSYEIISTPFLGRTFYDDTLRAVAPEGVETVMRIFFEGRTGSSSPEIEQNPAAPARARSDDVVCEEVLLEAFAR
ncbi:GSCFA domain-containing protein [Roseomonas indoligenes]|uniref:GSCFA domain-containing protein n=1 Tax=Roseomonas indoligenes TaxID=2820811 RepID=A0A940N1Y0_9PROT|nr:GSCFA domain-containing protein [Pararoseomonas indoligenes]MBP0495272.1 GSCFA domain-containing protein [Pararoseomonas indoligenes]